MYLPAHFAESRPEVLLDLMRAHPLATLVTQGEAPDANHIPLQFVPREGMPGVLRGHVARANPLWREIGEGVPALAIFHGPQAYVTRNWSPTQREHGKAVPTWNYAVVHAHGHLRAIDDSAWLRTQVEELTHREEAAFPHPWSVADAPADYIDKMIAAVVGIEMTVTRLVGKWKTSQNQPPDNRVGVVAGLGGRGPEGSAMAALVAAVPTER
ncbi:Protease synthase and sporulation protein PAI 2 [Rhodocyclaceae bacterium]|nr:Protease synthase and sporulation protein PAI 2 [Rhodocyclaceae bacterium]